MKKPKITELEDNITQLTFPDGNYESFIALVNALKVILTIPSELILFNNSMFVRTKSLPRIEHLIK